MQKLESMYRGIVQWGSAFVPVETITGLAALIAVALITGFIVRKVVIKLLLKLVQTTHIHFDDLLVKHKVHRYLARTTPAAIMHLGIGAVTGFPTDLADVVRNLAMAYIILMVLFACSALLSAADEMYRRSNKYQQSNRSIKGYVQLGKLLVYLIGAVFVISALTGRSPLLFFTGMGAMSAVLLLIFKDTILSLVASVQLSSNSIIRVGDWVEIPSLGVDGDVTDIALHTVTVRNFDKTLSYVPTSRFITDPVKNWRGMKELGARRIKRNILIDTSSIRFLNAEDMQRLQQISLLRDYMTEKQQQLKAYNEQLAPDSQHPWNSRRLTNIGTLRAYILRYLQQHPRVHQDPSLALMVRQMPPAEHGMPLEIYCFASTTVWSEYEEIQSDIFDHLLAVIPAFDLQVYQQPGSAVLAGIIRQSSHTGTAATRVSGTPPHTSEQQQ